LAHAGHFPGRPEYEERQRYLCWAFIEATNLAIRHNATIQRYDAHRGIIRRP
jgi:hypothetical protein